MKDKLYLKILSINTLIVPVSLLISTMVFNLWGGDLYNKYVFLVAVITVITSTLVESSQNFVIGKSNEQKKFSNEVTRELKSSLYVVAVSLIFLVAIQANYDQFSVSRGVYYFFLCLSIPSSVFFGFYMGLLRINKYENVANILNKLPVQVVIVTLCFASYLVDIAIDVLIISNMLLVILIGMRVTKISDQKKIISMLRSDYRYFIGLIVFTLVGVLHKQIFIIFSGFDSEIDVGILKFAFQFSLFTLIPSTSLFFLVVPKLSIDFGRGLSITQGFRRLRLMSTAAYLVSCVCAYYAIEVYFNITGTEIDVHSIQTYFTYFAIIYSVTVIFGPSNYLLSLLGHVLKSNIISLTSLTILAVLLGALRYYQINNYIFYALFVSQLYWRTAAWRLLNKYVLD